MSSHGIVSQFKFLTSFAIYISNPESYQKNNKHKLFPSSHVEFYKDTSFPVIVLPNCFLFSLHKYCLCMTKLGHLPDYSLHLACFHWPVSFIWLQICKNLFSLYYFIITCLLVCLCGLALRIFRKMLSSTVDLFTPVFVQPVRDESRPINHRLTRETKHGFPLVFLYLCVMRKLALRQALGWVVLQKLWNRRRQFCWPVFTWSIWCDRWWCVV